jgi:hypothetical protein
VVVTNWRGLPEFLPPGCERAVEPRAPERLALAIISLLGEGYDPRLRAHFLEHYTNELFVARIRAALLNL